MELLERVILSIVRRHDVDEEEKKVSHTNDLTGHENSTDAIDKSKINAKDRVPVIGKLPPGPEPTKVGL
eukprot:1857836-Rhodomonas_salina.1